MSNFLFSNNIFKKYIYINNISSSVNLGYMSLVNLRFEISTSQKNLETLIRRSCLVFFPHLEILIKIGAVTS